MPPKRKIEEVNQSHVNVTDEQNYYYLICSANGSHKFYEISITDLVATSRYGKVGTNGVTSFKEFDTKPKLQVYVDKMLKEKMKKEYVEVEGTSKTNNVSSTNTVHSNTATSKEATTTATSTSTSINNNEVEVIEVTEVTVSNPNPVSMVTYLEFKQGNSDKFYELIQDGGTGSVTVRYGKCGTDGITSLKTFDSIATGKKFVDKTASDKQKKGYILRTDTGAIEDMNIGHVTTASSSTTSTTSTSTSKTHLNVSSGGVVNGTAMSVGEVVAAPGGSGDPKNDLENGFKVFVKGSSAQPYTIKQFNGGYSCSCQGFTMNIGRKGIENCTCKHLKQVRGVAEEEDRVSKGGTGGTGTGGGSGGVYRYVCIYSVCYSVFV